jgi:hypothetical protein
MIDFSAAQMRQMNKSSVAVQNTGGYVGYFEVFHQLHCLKRMYQMNYPEHYSDLIDAHRMSLPHWSKSTPVNEKADSLPLPPSMLLIGSMSFRF